MAKYFFCVLFTDENEANTLNEKYSLNTFTFLETNSFNSN